MNQIEKILELAARECVKDELDCGEFWTSHDSYIVRTNRVINLPFFYSIYQWGDLYSFSPLPLLVRKGSFNVRASPRDLGVLGFDGVCDVSPPAPFIDRDLTRIGGPPIITSKIRERDAFVVEMAAAINADIKTIESRNPRKINVVLCGGKDSLNLLLADWRNPVVAYSAQPNYPLVREFVKQNHLSIEVRELRDEFNESLRNRELAESCGMVDLKHWRWTAHLVNIAETLDRQVIFWKGQFADAFLTDYWRSYTSKRSPIYRVVRKMYRKSAPRMPRRFRHIVDQYLLEDFRLSAWRRGAVLQGAHMGFLRSLTDCLVLSGYHGKHTSEVWLAASYPDITGADLRPAIGEELFGRGVVYPALNPAPPPSPFRQETRNFDELCKAFRSMDIGVECQEL